MAEAPEHHSERITPASDRRLIGVYRDRDAAERAAMMAERAGAHDVRIADRADDLQSLQAEMKQELTQGWIAPQAGIVLTKEAAKGVRLWVPLGAVIGGLLGFPFAFLDLAELPLWGKIIMTVMIGATAGGTVGYLFGSALAAKGPREPMAAEAGVTVAVPVATEAVERALRNEDPIRLDVIDLRDATATTARAEDEPEAPEASVARRLRDNTTER